eukprot:10324866-Ditylum_brightwellii.AAC.1
MMMVGARWRVTMMLMTGFQTLLVERMVLLMVMVMVEMVALLMVIVVMMMMVGTREMATMMDNLFP